MTAPQKTATILFAGGYVVSVEGSLYKLSEAARKTIAGCVCLPAKEGIEVKILPLTAVCELFFRRHFPRLLHPLLRPMLKPLKLLHALWRLSGHMGRLVVERHAYEALMVYNYSWATVTFAGFARWITRKRIFLDYEDGMFTDAQYRRYHAMLESVALRLADASILVNDELGARLPATMPSLVVSGIFPDLPATRSANSRPVLLYSGNVDMEFGLGLLMEELSTLGTVSLDVQVTGGGKGSGRLRTFLAAHDLPHVHYHAFIPTEDLLALEERASGYLILQNEDSPYYGTNYPSKFFYYLGRLTPVSVNRRSLFDPYLSIPNAFTFDRPADAAMVIQQHIDRKFDHQTARIMMRDYNQGIGKALGKVLLGGAYGT